MKKLLLIISMVLLLFVNASADLDTFIGSESIDTFVGSESIDEAVGVPIASAAACVTIEQSQLDTPNDNVYCGTAAAQTYTAGRFDVGGSGYDLCKVDLYLKKVVDDSSPAYVFTYELRADNSGEPSGSVMVTSTTTFGPGDLTTGHLPYTFELPSAQTLSASTSYWHVIKFTTLGDFGDYIIWAADDDTYTDQEESVDGTTWSDQTSAHMAYRNYK